MTESQSDNQRYLLQLLVFFSNLKCWAHFVVLAGCVSFSGAYGELKAI